MPDPDLEITGGPGLQNKIFGPWFGLKIRDGGGGGAGPPGPLFGSANDLFALSFFYPIIE